MREQAHPRNHPASPSKLVSQDLLISRTQSYVRPLLESKLPTTRGQFTMRRLLSIALVAFVVIGASCATIMHGKNQEVGISSTPSSAKVTVDNLVLGNTPVIAKLKRKDNHIVKI